MVGEALLKRIGCPLMRRQERGWALAKPRVFISSTYYDLRVVRGDLIRAVEQLGYEAVAHERSDVPYGNDAKLEEYCYREIGLCDILLSVVGGRFGSSSENAPYSISQMELKVAQKAGKPVYIFIEEGVYNDYRLYVANKDVESIRYPNSDDVAILRFIDELHQLRVNNPIQTFKLSQDIAKHLTAQFAGLFQRLLSERIQFEQARAIEDLRSTADTLNRLVTTLGEETELRSENVRYILLIDHPIFQALKETFAVSYRVFFTSLDELKEWLKFRVSVKREMPGNDEYYEWEIKRQKDRLKLKMARRLFDDSGMLKILTKQEWDVQNCFGELYEVVPYADSISTSALDDLDDEIPF